MPISEETRQKVIDHVIKAGIMRLSVEETCQYLSAHNLPCSVDTVKRYRNKIKKDSAKWVSSLTQSNRAEYIAQYQARISEIEAYQRQLWVIVHDKMTKSHAKVEALSKLLECTLRLTELYSFLPRLIDSLPIIGEDSKVIPYTSIPKELPEKEQDDSRVFA